MLNGIEHTAYFLIGQIAWDDSSSNLSDAILYAFSSNEIVLTTSSLQNFSNFDYYSHELFWITQEIYDNRDEATFMQWLIEN